MINPLASIGRLTLDLFQTVGSVTLFAAKGLSHAVRPPFFWRNYVRFFIEIGYLSLPVVALTTLFSGMVLDPWRYGGTLYWAETLKDEKYTWVPRQQVFALKRARRGLEPATVAIDPSSEPLPEEL